MRTRYFLSVVLLAGAFLAFGAGVEDVYAVKANQDCTNPPGQTLTATDEETGYTLVCSGGSWLPEIPQGPQTAGQVLTVIETIATWVFAIFLAVSVIFLVVGAFQFVTARGDPAQVNRAREILLYSMIGIGLAFLANAADNVLRWLLT
ncbi:MAG: hypothetical protein HYW97_02090 [Candidatus Wildermuthbacteria bacterium]|nr:hypothetical protein [Candidatus Wildermuthbacteria bacterium]